MVQKHDWLEGRGPRMSLILFIDDATSEIPIGECAKAETTRSYMKLTKEYIKENGLPRGIYSDKHSIFRQNQFQYKNRCYQIKTPENINR